MSSQIPLSFPVLESHAREDFMPFECNETALAWIDRWPDWSYPLLIIYGAHGAGKTHLAALWAEKAEGQTVIDDAQQYFGNKEAEEDIFHLFNMARENGQFILMIMDKPVSRQNITLPDLASRLKAAPQVEITAPDDMALQAVLIKLFHDRQIRIEPEVVAYILPRMVRSFSAAKEIVQQIDESSLSSKRSVSIPLVREVLPYNESLL